MITTKNHVAAIVFLLLVIALGCKKDTNSNQTVVVTNPTDGEILVSPYTSTDAIGTLLILDKNGKTMRSKQTGAIALNFQKWTVNGKVRYTYMEEDPKAYQIEPPAVIGCTAVILDENLNEVKRVTMPAQEQASLAASSAIDFHDFIYLDDNHYFTLTYSATTVNNIPASLNPAANCKVVTPIIQEILNDQVIFEWKGSTFPEFYQQSQEGNDFSNANSLHDYMHMNSMFIDPTDNNLILSFRNVNQVIKINRTSGAIMWRLGGTNSDFPINPEMKFLRQHNASLTDNNRTLLIYDNGEAAERPYTRIVEFNLSEANKSITSFKSFNLPGQMFSQYMGSVQKRGETYFVGGGTVPKILEINYNTGTINFLMNLEKNSYRGFKY